MFIVGFFILSLYYFAFDNQNYGCDKQQNIFFKFDNPTLKIFENDGCDKQQNIFFKFDNPILKIFTRNLLLHGLGDYEEIR